MMFNINIFVITFIFFIYDYYRLHNNKYGIASNIFALLIINFMNLCILSVVINIILGFLNMEPATYELDFIVYIVIKFWYHIHSQSVNLGTYFTKKDEDN